MGVGRIGRWVGVVTASAWLLGACSKAPEPAAASAPPQPAATSTTAAPPAADHAGIAWRQAATDPEVDAAFAEARAQSKPVFLYWGATWCPPCNQVKATLFNRQDFIERSRAFVPVYIDGDRPARRRSARASRSAATRRWCCSGPTAPS